MDRLIVKNFGPLKDVDIELNKINLFIGENGSGKSVLGKIITIVLDFNTSEDILKKFTEYNIGFILEDTVIEYHSDDKIYLKLQDKKIIFDNEIQKVRTYAKDVIQRINEVKDYTASNKQEVKALEDFRIELKGFQEKYQKLKSQYIPAERNLISLFNKSLTTLLVAEVPLPKFLLAFSSEFEKAGNEIQELEFLNVKYVNGDGADRHKVYFNDEYYLDLEQSSSGIQSALPLYLTVKYFAQKHSTIIIEEPEQNLFPKAQKETVEYIVEQISDENSLFMMTHSPYILTALNNLILANDVKEQKGLEAIEGIVKEEQCVAFKQVSAYMLVDGKSINIMDKEDRLIGVNLIDAISDEVSSTFDALLAKLD